MSFNKRYYTKENILHRANSLTFEEFDKFMTVSDLHIYRDEVSEKIHVTYLESDEDFRKKLFNSLKKREY